MEKLYLRTTTDKYELPIAVASSASELAKMLGVTPATVSSSISHHHKGWFKITMDNIEEEQV